MSYVARALEVDETRGFMKAVVDAETKQILGAAVLGIEGGEVMAVLEVAMMGKLPYTALLMASSPTLPWPNRSTTYLWRSTATSKKLRRLRLPLRARII